MSVQSQTSACLLQEINNFDQRPNLKAFLDRDFVLKGHVSCKHEYATNTDRSILPGNFGERPGKDTVWRVAATCLRCRCHVDVILQFDVECQSPCPVDGRPLHHFRHIPGSFATDSEAGEGIYQYRCTSSQCQADLVIQFQQPALGLGPYSHFNGEFAIRKRIADARLIYGDAVTQRSAYEMLRVFRLAITNCLGSDESRDIPLGSATFMSVFGNGQATRNMLESLGFQFISDPASPRGLGRWRTPKPEPHPPGAAPDSQRSALEDVRDELHILMAARPEAEKQKYPEPFVEPRYAQLDIAKMFGIQKDMIVPNQFNQEPMLRIKPPFAETIDTPYRDLGIVPRVPTSSIRWAYDQQVNTDPENAKRYLEALRDIANMRQSDDLQTEVALLQSQFDQRPPSVEEAYEIVGINTQHGMLLTDQIVCDTYQRKHDDAQAADRGRIVEALKVIGRYRNSQFLLKVADIAESPVMTYEDALKFLDAKVDTPDEWIPTLASTKAADSPSAEENVQSAVRIIAEHRKSELLLSQLTASAPVHRMDIKRAQTLLGIDDSGTFDAQHLITQFEINAKDQPGRASDLQEALEVVATATRNQQLIDYVQTLQSQNRQQVSDRPADEPRGLNNIGNTCYLASLLQYLYTIEPIRELVRRIDQHGQILQHGVALDKMVDDASVSKAQVNRALDFARELDKLFETLASTLSSVVTPEIALARLTLHNAVDEQTRRRSTLGMDIRPSIVKDDAEMTEGASGNDSAVEVTDSPEGMQVDKTVPTDSIGQPKPIEQIDLTASNGGEPVARRGSADTLVDPDAKLDDINPMTVQPAPPMPPRPSGSSPSQAADAKQTQLVEQWAQQQDVREVMANVLVQLRWAIRGDSTTEKGEQIDRISKLFYGTDQVVTVKPTGEERESNPFLEVIAYLSRPCDVYSLLDGAYDESMIEAANGISQYREISSLPPIMHISVERGQVDRMKCEEPLKLPELIYMDRYMSTPEILEKRRQAWIGRAQLRILQDKRDTLTKTATGLDIPQTMTSTQDYLQQIAENAAALGIDAELIDTPLLEALGSSAAAAHKQIEALNMDIAQHEQKLDSLFAEDRRLPYRLHAVFMHRSGQGRVDGGHWFIYIYDAKSAQWRRYNDETITKVMDPKPFLDPVQGRAREEGTSSFVVYVREDMADELVETVHRVPLEGVQTMQEVATAALAEGHPATTPPGGW